MIREAFAVVGTVMTAPPFICWYRVNVVKSHDRSLRVSIVAALKLTETTPQVTKNVFDSRSTAKFYIYPVDWFEDVQNACRRVFAEAQKVATENGLKLNERHVDPGFELYARKPVPAICDTHLNFLWVGVEVPFKAGQKKIAAVLTSEFKTLASEFKDLMALEVESPV